MSCSLGGSRCLVSIGVMEITLSSTLLLLGLVGGKGVNKGQGQRLTGKEFCQMKYEDCLENHLYLSRKGSNNPVYCEHQILRIYSCTTRLPDTEKSKTLKPLKNRSLGGGEEEGADSKLTVLEKTAKTFYIDTPPDDDVANNSTEEISKGNN